jgi:hypothetical protein
MYAVMGDPPLSMGADHVTVIVLVALSLIAPTPVGANDLDAASVVIVVGLDSFPEITPANGRI